MACLSFLLLGGKPSAASPEGFIPISVDNADQIQLLGTIEDYRYEGYCACDLRFFSQNGRMVATDRKIYDLATGITLDFTSRGYPVALSPDGTQALVSGQDTGTRLVDIVSGSEQELMPWRA
jgi:hypothetical protein